MSYWTSVAALPVQSVPSASSRVILFIKDFIYLFLERGEGREKERERNSSVRNIDRLPHVHAPTEGLSLGGMKPNHPNHTGQNLSNPFKT